MLTKIYYVVLLFILLGIQASPHVEISKLENNQCSKNVGKVDLTFNYASSYTEKIDSFFMLKFVDKANKKRPTICKLALNEESTDSGDSKADETDETDKPNKPDEPVVPSKDIDELLQKLLEKLGNDIEKSLKGAAKIGDKMQVLNDDLLDLINLGMLKNIKKINTKMHKANEQLESNVKKYIGISLNDTLKELKEKLTNFRLDDLISNKINLTNIPLMEFLEKFKNQNIFNETLKQLDKNIKSFYMNKIVSRLNDTLTDLNKKIVKQLYNLQEKVNEIEEIKNRHNESNIKEIIEERIEILQYMLESLNETIQNFLNDTKLGRVVGIPVDIFKKIIQKIGQNKISNSFRNYTDKIKKTIYNKTNDLAESLNETLISFLTKGKDNLLGVLDFLEELDNLKGNGTVDKLLSLIDIIDNRLKDKNMTVNFTDIKDILESLPEFNDDVKKNISEIFSNITDILKQFKLSELFKLNNNKTNDLLESLNETLISFLIKRKDNLLGVLDFIKELSDLKGNGTVDKLWSLIDIIDDRLKDKNITVNFTNLKGSLESLPELNNNIIKSFSDIFINITDILNQFKLSEIYKFNNKTNDLLESLNETLISFLTKGKDNLFGVLDFIKELSDLKGNGTVDKLLSLIDIIDDRLKDKNITVNFTDIKDALESLPEFKDDVKKNISEIFSNITDILKQFKLSIFNNYNNNNKNIINISNERINDIEKSLNDYKNDFIDKLSNLNLLQIKELFKGIKNKTMSLIPDEIENSISNNSDFKILPLKESFNTLKEKIVESKTVKFIEDLKESISNFDIENLPQIEKIKNEVEKIKGYFNQENATFLVEKERESVKKVMNGIKSKVLAFIDESKFAPLITKLKDINSLISDSFKKMESYEDFAKFANKVKDSNNALNTFFDNIQIFILNSYFSFKQNIHLNETSQKEYLKKLGKEVQEQLKKLKDMETITAKISYILKSTLRLNKEQRESLDKSLKNLKTKAEETNKTQLIKLIEKLNEMNTKADKISEEKVKQFFDKIVDVVDKMEKNYDNAEPLFEEKKEKFKKDLEELESSKLAEELNISYDQIVKDEEEYKEIFKGIIEYYKNLPEDANFTEIFEKRKVKIVEEMTKIQQKVKDTFNDLDLECDLNNLKGKFINSSLNGNLTQLLDEHFLEIKLLTKFFKKMSDSDLAKVLEKILSKLSMNNSTLLKFFQKMKSPEFLNGTAKIKETISFLKEIKTKFNQSELSQDKQLLVEKIKELNECLLVIKNSSQLKTIIKEAISDTDNLSLKNLINTIKGNKNLKKELLNLMKIDVLIDEIKEILSPSRVMKNIESLFDNKNSAARSLSASSKKKKRGLNSNGQLVCKMDQTFSEDDELKPATPDLKLYFLSEEQHDLSISQSLKITVKKSEYNCNNDEFLAKMRSVYKMKSHSNFKVEKQKLRVKFTIHLKKTAQFTRPPFFYILVKFRFKFAVHNLRRLADENENIESYCILNDESNDEDNTFGCFAFPDNINELEDPEGIQNITSDYIDVPKDVPESNDGNNGGNNGGNNDGNNDGNSTVPDDNNNYYTGMNSFKSTKGRSLSGGAIAGIVIACVAVIAIIAALLIYSRGKVVRPAPIENSFNSVNALKPQ